MDHFIRPSLPPTVDCRFMAMTPPQPGAIAIIQLHGDVIRALTMLTGESAWPTGHHRLAAIATIDDAVVARLSDNLAQIMPHGGIRVVQRLTARMAELGFVPLQLDEADPMALYPEARDRFESLMLLAMSHAESPLAVDLLLEQPRRWRAHFELGRPLSESDLARSRRLNRLITPPNVVVAGPTNVGKSTLANALLGRAMSIALDQPGTTRDYTVGRVDLAGLVVNWHDTPGIRQTGDPIERRAIVLSRRLIEASDLLIALTDHDHDWAMLPREPDLRVLNKVDEQTGATSRYRNSTADSSILRISALRGDGLAKFVQTVRDALVTPEDYAHQGPWLFDERLSRS